MVVAIIQARMGSTRLPGKILMDIGGETMLARVVRRVQRATMLDQVVVATTFLPSDDVTALECERLDVPVYRGSELDVLGRYYWTAKKYQAEVVVRITADCPLIDPEIIDQVVLAFLKSRPDFASNTIIRTYPRGLDVSVMSQAALTRAWKEARRAYDSEHVTSYIYQNPNIFRLLPVVGEVDYSNHHWTVDTQEDLDFVRGIYARLGENTFGGLDATLRADHNRHC